MDIGKIMSICTNMYNLFSFSPKIDGCISNVFVHLQVVVSGLTAES